MSFYQVYLRHAAPADLFFGLGSAFAASILIFQNRAPARTKQRWLGKTERR